MDLNIEQYEAILYLSTVDKSIIKQFKHYPDSEELLQVLYDQNESILSKYYLVPNVGYFSDESPIKWGESKENGLIILKEEVASLDNIPEKYITKLNREEIGKGKKTLIQKYRNISTSARQYIKDIIENVDEVLTYFKQRIDQIENNINERNEIYEFVNGKATFLKQQVFLGAMICNEVKKNNPNAAEKQLRDNFKKIVDEIAPKIRIYSNSEFILLSENSNFKTQWKSYSESEKYKDYTQEEQNLVKKLILLLRRD